MFTCTDAPCVDHVAYKDAPIANLARVSSFDDDFYRKMRSCRLWPMPCTS